jgi:uncharacterized membrane protein
LDFGQRAADYVANVVGSWRFIIGQSGLIVLWVIINSLAWSQHWDPYPFILMNLVLSMQAALTAPIIMMSQNRQADKDRIESHNDYTINMQAEAEIRTILNFLQENEERSKIILESMTFLQQKLDDLSARFSDQQSGK